MYKRGLLAIIVAAALALPAFPARSQTEIKASIKKGRLSWDWTQGDGGVAEAFRVKCGNTAGQYSKVTTLTADLRSVPISSIITGPGVWFCVVTAVNSFDESKPTNEVSFNAGDSPNSPTNNRVEIS